MKTAPIGKEFWWTIAAVYTVLGLSLGFIVWEWRTETVGHVFIGFLQRMGWL